MGLKENFSHAVRDLTGNAKEDERKKSAQVAGLKRALGDDNDFLQTDNDNQNFIEGTSQPYYRNVSEQPAQNQNTGYETRYGEQSGGYNAGSQAAGSYNARTADSYTGSRAADSYNRSGTGYSEQGTGYNARPEQSRSGYNSRDNGYTEQNRGYGYRSSSYTEQDRGYNRSGGYTEQDRGYSRSSAYNDGYDSGNNRYSSERQYDVNRGQNERSYYDANNSRSYGQGFADGQNANDTYSVPGKNQDNYDNSDYELTVISKNTMIDGNVRSFANMSIDGDVKGDVETTKDIDLNGRIVGNVTCNNAHMSISQIQGNVLLKGNVEIGRDTLLIGDLSSGFASINGKVKGNVEIAGKAEFKADAVVFGDISASTITVDDGAIIQGYVSTTFLNKDESANIFPEAVTIED